MYPSTSVCTYVQAFCHSRSQLKRGQARPRNVRFVIPSSALSKDALNLSTSRRAELGISDWAGSPKRSPVDTSRN